MGWGFVFMGAAWAALTSGHALAHSPQDAAVDPGTPQNPDTGITAQQCYAVGSNALVACNATPLGGQDGQLGRDTYPSTNTAADGLLGLSFTKVCNSGQLAGTGTCPADPALGPNPDDWACVQDNVTNIMWEVKTTSGFRAGSHLYTNYSPTYNPVGQYGSSTDATGYINRVNKAALCGYTDWNLAHSDKVQTGLDYGISNGAPRLDPTFFPNLNATWYWNNSPNPSSNSTAFAVDFADGTITNSADRSTLRYVIALRNGKDSFGLGGRYTVSPDGTEVADSSFGAQVTWRRCVEGMSWNGTTCAGTPLLFTHEQALQWAAQQAPSASGILWRVPSVKEQNWIVQREIASPPLQHNIFPSTPPQPSWTSTPEVDSPDQAWTIDFGVGLVMKHPRTDLLMVRLVRDSDPASSTGP